ncbi:unnamed protein product [Heligmosomoides polygyrus]|uniref:Uncharacterized protein n=1 Tax=Heligmosomoides polygyrus TaxID=6339 RepID=A0A183FFL6_HELPZ|nr:unnamed protein product [Heligmosomoides polygyrus]
MVQAVHPMEREHLAMVVDKHLAVHPMEREHLVMEVPRLLAPHPMEREHPVMEVDKHLAVHPMEREHLVMEVDSAAQMPHRDIMEPNRPITQESVAGVLLLRVLGRHTTVRNLRSMQLVRRAPMVHLLGRELELQTRRNFISEMISMDPRIEAGRILA